MQAFNIRQLKTNPSTALKAAKEEDLVVVMNRDQPEALLIDLDRLGVPDLAAVRVALAASLFRSGSISAGFAARMADKPLAEMLDLLSTMSIPLGGTKADVQEDMATARKWLDTRS